MGDRVGAHIASVEDAPDEAEMIAAYGLRCDDCAGSGRFATQNADGRFGPLYPRTLPCPTCGGTGNAREPKA